MSQQSSKPAKPSQPATPFAQRYIQRNGAWECPKCRAKVTSFPHDCKTWGAR